MIFQSFLLGNLVSLCMKIINSVVVVGLYYGFLTTFSIGPSYLFLLRALVMEEGTEKKVSATAGFITGQLMMFISIYYAPLHLALGRPHTITVLALPYLLFHFFWNNHKHFFDYGSTTRNSMRNLSIQCVFLNNLIFQLFNHFILPSSMLARLVNIYLFRCNNKILFVTSGFVGWLIGHILFMKWLGLVLVWIRQNHSIRPNKYIRSNKYLVLELRNSMARIFSILLFITCVYYLGRIPSPILTKKLKEASKTEERVESEEERDVEIETASEMKGTKQEQEGSTEEDPYPSLFSEEGWDPDKIYETEEIRVNGKDKIKDKFHSQLTETGYNNINTSNSPIYYYSDSYLNNNNTGNPENFKLQLLDKKNENKDLFWFQKPLVSLLFDYNRWNRPFRYIKNNRFEQAVRTEMSQYFFDTCKSDGKQRISFTYPPSLSTFWKMIKGRLPLLSLQKTLPNELDNQWVSTNKEKNNNLNKEFLNRLEVLDKKSLSLDILETRTRLCNDDTKKEYVPKMYDPLLNGPYRGTIKKGFSPSNINNTSLENFKDRVILNRIHTIFLTNTDYQEFEQKVDTVDKKPLSTEIDEFLTLINEFVNEPKYSLNFKDPSLFSDQEQGRVNSEKKTKFVKFIFNAIDPNGTKSGKKSIGIKEISKKIPCWSRKLITELEQQLGEFKEGVSLDHQIRSRKFRRVVIFTTNMDSDDPEVKEEVALISYSQQSDFRRGIIKGSMRAQRRKTVIWKLFQANVHSPLFLDRITPLRLFSFDISGLIKPIFRNWSGKEREFEILEFREEQPKREEKKETDKKGETKRKKEKARIAIAEAWDTIPFAQIIRGYMLITQSILRKYILLPSLIIAKNLGRMLFLQLPEWSEDLEEWNREMHIKCTYNGVQLSETEFPKNWLRDGIQIKILFPFCLKPWHISKLYPSHEELMKKKKQKDDFCFLTVWGMEAELPFGSPRSRPSFFEPIFKELEKKNGKLKNKYFITLKVLKGKTKLFRRISKETKKWLIKSILFIKKIKKELSKINLIVFFRFKEISESNETKKEKDSLISNQIINESVSQIESVNLPNSSLIENKMKDLTDRTSTIKNKIERITKDKKKVTPEIDISRNKKNNIKKSKSTKNFFEILQRRNTRLIWKFNYFFKLFIQRLYVDIFLSIINITRINIQLFLESTNKLIDKYISNNEINQEKINNKKKINFILTIKKSIYNISKKNSHIFFDLSYLSQAYVFYKLSQTQVINLSKFRSVLQYNRTSFFLKTKIKYYFRTLGIFHSELKHKKLQSYRMNQWKNWLRRHYQYDLSQIRWSRLMPQKWRNRVNQSCMAQNKNINLKKWNSYENDQLIHYKKENDYELYSLSNQKDNFQKCYRYALLSYKSINYENKSDSFISGLPFRVNKNLEISYNSNAPKHKFFDMPCDPHINNYLRKGNILYIERNLDRKYFDWKIIHFSLRQKGDIEAWVKIDTNNNPNTKFGINNYQIIDKIDKKGLFYLTIHQNTENNQKNYKKVFFDWMGMNEKIFNRPIFNLEFWFFPEFVLLYNVYKKKPWIIPSKLLLLNLNTNENVSKNKNINKNQKQNFFIPSNKKINNRIQEAKEPASQGERERGSDIENKVNPGPVLSKHQNDLEKDYAESDTKKGKKKKQYKSNTEAELDLFLKRYLLFQLNWNDDLNQRMIENIKVYCLLLRLINPTKISISSVQRGEMSLDIMLIKGNLTLTELMKKGILIIEPIRLSVKNNGQFIMYQTIGISLVHKSKHQTNQRYRDQRHVDKKKMDEFILKPQTQRINTDKNHFYLLVPENILWSRRRREFRIRSFFNSLNWNGVDRNSVFCNETNVKNWSKFLDERKPLYKDKNELIKLKFFLWPNYRLEDLACMNRYWFDTNNGSRFSILRIHMYPRLKIN
uniref:Protein TIC 214 n=1 Tax=Hyoscyamus niger TaxID=4079 RepID=A0A059Q666_HYONI|nr:hypothetical chloroplast RF19 [Hyoscyamus niger]AGU46528.1 hypothetical chloroplast RF19 [Hyoscyamus niger]